MKTLKGILKNLRTYETDSVEQPQKMVFSIDNNVVELNTTQDIIAKNGDKVIVAGVEERNRIFTAYSYRKIT